MQNSDGFALGLPRPGKALIGLMVAIAALWLMFAVGLNWGGAAPETFLLLALELQFTTLEQAQPVLDLIVEISKMLTSLRNRLQQPL